MNKAQTKIGFKSLLAMSLALAAAPTSQSFAWSANRGAPDVGRTAIADSPNIPEVAMHEYLISSASAQPLLETFGASTCVIVTLWDPSTKIGMLAHVSAAIDGRKSLNAILARMKSQGINPRNLQARLLGGWLGWSESIVSGLELGLRDDGVQVVSRDVLNPNVPSMHGNGELGKIMVDPSRGVALKNIIFDLRNGQIYDYQEMVAPPEGHKLVNANDGQLSAHPKSL